MQGTTITTDALPIAIGRYYVNAKNASCALWLFVDFVTLHLDARSVTEGRVTLMVEQ